MSSSLEWDAAQVRRLARRLGYVLVWPPDVSLIPLIDRVRAADVDAVITPALSHLDVVALHAVMAVADVETVSPRMSFARWALIPLTGVRACKAVEAAGHARDTHGKAAK
ncbi:hypothetical protein [Nocardia mexicana]|uniref:hypothetical protein n=1 Tax=Nocardia mexicana TaxID=279262 RepID=UPI0027D900AE|nr:hypothetical protein [Nocardia mexicana]